MTIARPLSRASHVKIWDIVVSILRCGLRGMAGNTVGLVFGVNRIILQVASCRTLDFGELSV